MLKGKLFLLIALVVGMVLGSGLTWKAMSTSQPGFRRCAFPETVAVAVNTIPAGTVLTPDSVALRDMPPEFVSSSMVKESEAGRILGQAILADLQPGDPLLWSQFDLDRDLGALPEECAEGSCAPVEE